jgi:hypothetical protein
MDDAERWLSLNDPEYRESSGDWKDVKSRVYRTPRQEVPWGGSEDLSDLVEAGAEYVESVDRRACERCGELFVPATSWHRFCSRACNEQARRRRSV